MKIPHITDELVEFLDALYPERCPELSWTDREVWARAGERRVVRKLKQMLADQIERAQIKSN